MKMQVKQIIVVEGHLTTSDKTAIKRILEVGLTNAKVGKKTFSISENEGVYSVSYSVRDRGLIPVFGSPLRTSTYRATFRIK